MTTTDNDERAYQAFVRVAETLRSQGREYYSARGIIYYLRLHTDINDGDDAFKINNNRSTVFADRLVHERPEFDGFFKRRGRKRLRFVEELFA